jgi:hypothetical protein
MAVRHAAVVPRFAAGIVLGITSQSMSAEVVTVEEPTSGKWSREAVWVLRAIGMALAVGLLLGVLSYLPSRATYYQGHGSVVGSALIGSVVAVWLFAGMVRRRRARA